MFYRKSLEISKECAYCRNWITWLNSDRYRRLSWIFLKTIFNSGNIIIAYWKASGSGDVRYCTSILNFINPTFKVFQMALESRVLELTIFNCGKRIQVGHFCIQFAFCCIIQNIFKIYCPDRYCVYFYFPLFSSILVQIPEQHKTSKVKVFSEITTRNAVAKHEEQKIFYSKNYFSTLTIFHEICTHTKLNEFIISVTLVWHYSLTVYSFYVPQKSLNDFSDILYSMENVENLNLSTISCDMMGLEYKITIFIRIRHILALPIQ